MVKESQQQRESLDKRLQQLENKLTSKPSVVPQHVEPSSITKSPIPLSDRKFNLVAYGIPECQPNADRKSRQKHDLDFLLKHLSEIDSGINPSFFKDIYRLGKFNNSSSKPRPFLLKFLRSADVDYVCAIIQIKTQVKTFSKA